MAGTEINWMWLATGLDGRTVGTAGKAIRGGYDDTVVAVVDDDRRDGGGWS